MTRVDFTDLIVDAYGGSCAALQRRSRDSDSFESIDAQQGQRRGLLRRKLSLFGLFRRMTMIGSRTLDRRSGFEYGGRTSNESEFKLNLKINLLSPIHQPQHPTF